MYFLSLPTAYPPVNPFVDVKPRPRVPVDAATKTLIDMMNAPVAKSSMSKRLQKDEEQLIGVYNWV